MFFNVLLICSTSQETFTRFACISAVRCKFILPIRSRVTLLALSQCQWGNTGPHGKSFTHWGQDKIAAISQTTFSNAFPWMEMDEFRLRFHRSLFLRFELTLLQRWFRYWLGADHATSHYLNQWWLVFWRIYASLGLNELIWIQQKWYN